MAKDGWFWHKIGERKRGDEWMDGAKQDPQILPWPCATTLHSFGNFPVFYGLKYEDEA
jgi:hypothetical protein